MAAIIVFALAAILLLGNLALRALRRKELHFGFNCIILFLLFAGFVYLLFSQYDEIILKTF